jgi:hypothetical protein
MDSSPSWVTYFEGSSTTVNDLEAGLKRLQAAIFETILSGLHFEHSTTFEHCDIVTLGHYILELLNSKKIQEADH